MDGRRFVHAQCELRNYTDYRTLVQFWLRVGQFQIAKRTVMRHYFGKCVHIV
jgi:hypothetical protein